MMTKSLNQSTMADKIKGYGWLWTIVVFIFTAGIVWNKHESALSEIQRLELRTAKLEHTLVEQNLILARLEERSKELKETLDIVKREVLYARPNKPSPNPNGFQ
jgi:hypothetical protein